DHVPHATPRGWCLGGGFRFSATAALCMSNTLADAYVQDLPGAGGPISPGDLRVAHAWRSGGEGPHGALRHLAAGGLAAPRHFERRRPGERPARRALCLLPGGAAGDEAAHRLDRALPRILDGARRSP